ncbi:RidA family protein [Paraburkholderia sediminicola]|uniref:RidA family protein n=1 Tax=Paraburkholderia sediminicola TaxID=458836 RepID=UPI0038B7A61A
MNEITRFGFRNRIHLGVIHNNIVYLTGQVGTPGKSVVEQMSEVLKKVDGLLEEAGTSNKRILHATLVLADIRDFAAVNEVWDTWVNKECAPARSTLEGRLATNGLLVELIIVAAI